MEGRKPNIIKMYFKSSLKDNFLNIFEGPIYIIYLRGKLAFHFWEHDLKFNSCHV